MSLEYSGSYHCHCSISLNSGTQITLKSIHQRMTYLGLLEGTPNAELNNSQLKHVITEANRRFPHFHGEPALLPPARRPFLRRPGDMDSIPRHRHVPEWLPLVTCMAEFEYFRPVKDPEMHASSLIIIWFQDEYAMPIAETALDAIRSLDWASHAVDFEY